MVRHLRDVHQADALLCQLVAHHSYAIAEAEERGLADVLASEFEPAPYVLSSVLTCCDMTTSPDGELVPADRRLAEIHHRYGPGHPVSRSIQRTHTDDPPQSTRFTAGPPGPRSSADRRAMTVSCEASAEPLACEIPGSSTPGPASGGAEHP
jgi:hypothetical protein